MANYNYLFKTIIIGNSGVGKSNILSKYVNNINRELYDVTIGIEFGCKMEEYNDMRIKMQIWDTAGQEVFQSIVKNYFRNITICIFVYDVTNRLSFNNIKYWINEFENNKLDSKITPLKIMVGNKVDLINKQVSTSEGLQLSKDYEMDYFFETSCKMGNSVNLLFKKIIELVFNKIDGASDCELEQLGIKTNKNIVHFESPTFDKTSYCCK